MSTVDKTGENAQHVILPPLKVHMATSSNSVFEDWADFFAQWREQWEEYQRRPARSRLHPPISSEVHAGTTSNDVESPTPTVSHGHVFKDEADHPFRRIREDWAIFQGHPTHMCLSAHERLKARYARPRPSIDVESPGTADSYNRFFDHDNGVEDGWLLNCPC